MAQSQLAELEQEIQDLRWGLLTSPNGQVEKLDRIISEHSNLLITSHEPDVMGLAAEYLKQQDALLPTMLSAWNELKSTDGDLLFGNIRRIVMGHEPGSVDLVADFAQANQAPELYSILAEVVEDEALLDMMADLPEPIYRRGCESVARSRYASQEIDAKGIDALLDILENPEAKPILKQETARLINSEKLMKYSDGIRPFRRNGDHVMIRINRGDIEAATRRLESMLSTPNYDCAVQCLVAYSNRTEIDIAKKLYDADNEEGMAYLINHLGGKKAKKLETSFIDMVKTNMCSIYSNLGLENPLQRDSLLRNFKSKLEKLMKYLALVSQTRAKQGPGLEYLEDLTTIKIRPGVCHQYDSFVKTKAQEVLNPVAR